MSPKQFGTCVATLVTALLFVSLATPVNAVCGDVNATGTVSATDALAVLKKGVGLDVTLTCPTCS